MNSKKRPQEVRDKISRGLKGKPKNNTSWLKGKTGKDHPSFKHGKGYTRDYDHEKYAAWKQGVLRVFSFKCFLTGKTTNLQAHHLVGWWNESTRYDISNGVALTEEVHMEFHNDYGRGRNTPEQFENFCREKYNVTHFPWRYGNQQPSLSQQEHDLLEKLAALKKTEFQELVLKRGHKIVSGEYKNNSSPLVLYCPLHDFTQSISKAGKYKKSKFGLACCAKAKQSQTTSQANKRRKRRSES